LCSAKPRSGENIPRALTGFGEIFVVLIQSDLRMQQETKRNIQRV
jgi:hypothetical protein